MHLGDTWGGGWNQHRSQCDDRGLHQRHVPMATPPIPPRRHPSPGASRLNASILFPRKHAAPRAPARPPRPLQTPLLQKHADAWPLSGRVRVGGRLLDSPQNKLHKHTHTHCHGCLEDGGTIIRQPPVSSYQRQPDGENASDTSGHVCGPERLSV